MPAHQVTIDLPPDVVEELSWPASTLGERVRLELAVHLFEKRRLSMAQSRRLAGLTRWEFLDALRERRIAVPYGPAQVEEDLATATVIGP
jgi:predicted HTH domain antitoxin